MSHVWPFSCTFVSRCWTTTTGKRLISHLSRMGTQDNNFLFLFLNFYLPLQNLTPKNSPTFRVVKSSRLPVKIATYLVSIGQLLCLAFLDGWSFLNKISLDWPLTLTTQQSTSKLSDNPDIWRIKQDGISAIKFEAVRIHLSFKVMFSELQLSLLLI